MYFIHDEGEFRFVSVWMTTGEVNIIAAGKTFPEAICRAFLKMVHETT
jgi:hypothetical protein